MFAVMQLMLWIAPFWLAWKLIEFLAELSGDYLKDRRRRRAQRPPRDPLGAGVVFLYLFLGGAIGLAIAWLIAPAL